MHPAICEALSNLLECGHEYYAVVPLEVALEDPTLDADTRQRFQAYLDRGLENFTAEDYITEWRIHNMQELSVMVKADNVATRFKDVLGDDAPAFINSVLTVVNQNEQLQKCDPTSILSAAITAATLRLPVNPSLGQAYLVPFNNQCTLQIGWKGLIQLAQRTRRFKTITSAVVYEGEITSFNKFTEEITFGERQSNKVVGYFARFELLDGFSKSMYMSVDEMDAHALRYSRPYQYDRKNNRRGSVWSQNFDAMACKTILKRLLSQYAPVAITDHNLAVALNADYINEGDLQAVEDVGVMETIEPDVEVLAEGTND